MKKFSIFVLWALLVVACGGGDDDSDDVNIRRDKITITDKIVLSGDGDNQKVDISATCNWITSECNEWLTITPTKGDKDTKSISFSADRNTTGVARSTVFSISGGDAQTVFVTVTQKKASDSQDPTSSGEPSADDNLPPT